MLAEFIDVSGWTAEQWLAACILVFIIITVIIVMHRTVKIFQFSRKPSYQPSSIGNDVKPSMDQCMY